MQKLMNAIDHGAHGSQASGRAGSDSVLGRLSRGLSILDPGFRRDETGSRPPYRGTGQASPGQASVKTQAEIDAETENLMGLLRRSATMSKMGDKVNAWTDTQKPSIKALSADEKPASVVSLPPEGQSHNPGPLGDNDLMDRYIFSSFNADEEGKSTETLDAVLEKIKAKVPNIDIESLEEHMARMEEEGKIEIKVSVTFDKDKLRGESNGELHPERENNEISYDFS